MKMKWLNMLKKNKITVGEIIDAWLEHQKRECTQGHYYACAGVNKNYWQEIRSLRWCALESSVIKEYQDNKWGSAKSANRTLRNLKTALNWAEEEELIPHNPIRKVRRLRTEKNIKYIPSPTDVQKCIVTCRPNRYALYLFYINTGARKQEAFHLLKRDTFLEGDEPFVVLYTQKKRDRNRTPRNIPIPLDYRPILIEQIANTNSEYVFTHSNGKPLKSLSRWLPMLCKKAGVKPYQFHALRHYYAHDLWKNGASIDTIQMLLGHENQITTKVYLSQIRVPYSAVQYISRAAQVSESITINTIPVIPTRSVSQITV